MFTIIDKDLGDGDHDIGNNNAPMNTPNLYVEVGEVDYSRSDERILQDIHNKLINIADFNSNQIEIIVDDGFVILNGMVEGSVTKGMIEYTIADIAGIKEIKNNLRIDGVF